MISTIYPRTINKNFALRIQAGLPLVQQNARSLTIAFCLQQLTNITRRSCLVYNSCGLMPSRTEGRTNICTRFLYLKPEYLPGKVWGRTWTWQQNHQCQLSNSLRSNYGTILLIFLDMITGQSTGQTMAITAYWPLRLASKKLKPTCLCWLLSLGASTAWVHYQTNII